MLLLDMIKDMFGYPKIKVGQVWVNRFDAGNPFEKTYPCVILDYKNGYVLYYEKRWDKNDSRSVSLFRYNHRFVREGELNEEKT